MAEAGQRTADMVGAAARLHGDDAGRDLGAKLHESIAAQASTQDDLATAI